jgi:hypothetical protein
MTMRIRIMKKLISLVAGAGLALIAVKAQAIPTFRILDLGSGETLFEVADNGPGDRNPGPGLVSAFGPFGAFNSVMGSTKPAVGSAAEPFMQFNYSQTSTAPLSLLVAFSETGYSGIFPGFITTVNGLTSGSVTAFSSYDPGNVLFGQAADGTVLSDAGSLD